jgi:hypothetical protein
VRTARVIIEEDTEKKRKEERYMAAPPARGRADYDYLIKLLLIGDSG